MALPWDTHTKPKASPFHFQKMWLNRPSFDDLVKLWWEEESHVYETTMFTLTTKLQRLKNKLKLWNKTYFGDVTMTRASLEEDLQLIQLKMIQQQDP